MMTNRPTYALERRPGESTELETAARELVVLTTTLRDAPVIAALLEAGSAALKYAPARASAPVELNSRHSDYRLGAIAAKALRAEAVRVHERNEARHAKPKRRARR